MLFQWERENAILFFLLTFKQLFFYHAVELTVLMKTSILFSCNIDVCGQDQIKLKSESRIQNSRNSEFRVQES
jgi:hypothetical protein